MNTDSKELLSAIMIHLVIPIIGLLYFIKIIIRMNREKIDNPPILALFMLFGTYGGLLLIILTSIFWKLSGLASLMTLYLIVGAPIIMYIIAHTQHSNTAISKYHYWTYKLSISYFLIAMLLLVFCVVMSLGKHS